MYKSSGKIMTMYSGQINKGSVSIGTGREVSLAVTHCRLQSVLGGSWSIGPWFGVRPFTLYSQTPVHGSLTLIANYIAAPVELAPAVFRLPLGLETSSAAQHVAPTRTGRVRALTVASA